MPQTNKNPWLFSLGKPQLLIIVFVVTLLGFVTVKDYSRYSKVTENAKSIKNEATNNSIQKNKVALIAINSLRFSAEVADTPELRELGLSYRDRLEENTGMVFIFDTPTATSFWMKDMNFPLDIIWIKDYKVIDISENVPAPLPDTPISSLPTYYPSDKINYVIEVNAGYAKKNGIKVGDTVIVNF